MHDLHFVCGCATERSQGEEVNMVYVTFMEELLVFIHHEVLEYKEKPLYCSVG